MENKLFYTSLLLWGALAWPIGAAVGVFHRMDGLPFVFVGDIHRWKAPMFKTFR